MDSMVSITNTAYIFCTLGVFRYYLKDDIIHEESRSSVPTSLSYPVATWLGITGHGLLDVFDLANVFMN